MSLFIFCLISIRRIMLDMNTLHHRQLRGLDVWLQCRVDTNNFGLQNSAIFESFNALSIICLKKCKTKLQTFWVAKVLMSPYITSLRQLEFCATPKLVNTLAELKFLGAFNHSELIFCSNQARNSVNEASIVRKDSYIFYSRRIFFFITAWINVNSAPLIAHTLFNST